MGKVYCILQKLTLLLFQNNTGSILFLSFMLSVISCSKTNRYHNESIPSPPITGKTYSATEIVAFKELAFSATTGDDGFIKKWRSNEVFVYMVDTSFSYLNDELDAIISDFNGLTQPELTLKKTTDRSSAGLLIYLTDKSIFFDAEPVAGNAYQALSRIGFTYAFWGSDKKIDRAVIFNDITRPDYNTIVDNRYVMRHEMMHALGFLGHVTLPEFSGSCLFNSFNLTTDYTSFDKRMITLLYNPAIKAGMKEAELNLVLVNL